VENSCHSLSNLVIFFYSDEVRRQLNHCVRDGLVRLIKRVGFKGSKIGVEQEGYRLPQNMVCIMFFFFKVCCFIMVVGIMPAAPLCIIQFV